MYACGELCHFRLLTVFDLSSHEETSSVAHNVSSHTDSVLQHCCMPCAQMTCFQIQSPVSTLGILSSCVWVNVNRPSLPLLCPVSSHCWLFPCLCLLYYMSQMKWTLEFSGGPVRPGVFGEHSQNLHVIQ